MATAERIVTHGADGAVDDALALMNQFCESKCEWFMSRCSGCPQEGARQALVVARTKGINGKV